MYEGISVWFNARPVLLNFRISESYILKLMGPPVVCCSPLWANNTDCSGWWARRLYNSTPAAVKTLEFGMLRLYGRRQRTNAPPPHEFE